MVLRSKRPWSVRRNLKVSGEELGRSAIVALAKEENAASELSGIRGIDGLQLFDFFGQVRNFEPMAR